MLVRYKSLGAAGSVTGSRHYFEIGEFNVLIDCGLFQGHKDLRLRNWDVFPVNPADIDAVIISHAHIDHSGYLPKLIKEGFDGPVYCTAATSALLQIMLMDSAKLQQEEAEWAFRKGYSHHKQPLPLYTEADAERVFPFLNPVEFGEILHLNDQISICFHPAGHILGAAITELGIQGLNQYKKIVYSGDLGRENDALLLPPKVIKYADILLIESTYGDRNNDFSQVKAELARIVNETYDNGCLLIPAFSVGRTQNFLYYLKQLMEENTIPKLPVYIDSPMAISVTDLYKSFPHIQKMRETDMQISLFDYESFHYVRDQSASQDINEIKNKGIIISASGMCTGGRILHHLYHRLPNENDTVLLVGYQAEGTRGRRLQEGEKQIRIFGEMVDVKCKVEMLDGLSAHADMNELMKWVGNFSETPKKTFIVHGEKTASENLSRILKTDLGWNSIVPEYKESFELFNGI